MIGRKYLRVCGEEDKSGLELMAAMEIPPRVRRRASTMAGITEDVGNTSACAEKRGGAILTKGWNRKYLRVCGEETRPARNTRPTPEIPPRVRRRASTMAGITEDVGNTSACAEKRGGAILTKGWNRKYLRVCGEETRPARNTRPTPEIPPRVRRRALDFVRH